MGGGFELIFSCGDLDRVPAYRAQGHGFNPWPSHT